MDNISHQIGVSGSNKNSMEKESQKLKRKKPIKKHKGKRRFADWKIKHVHTRLMPVIYQ